MRITALVLAGAALIAAPSAAQQTIGIGSTLGGATAQVSTAIAKVVTNSGLQMRPQPMGGTDKYMIAINRSELEFGSSNMMQYYMGVTGTGISEGMKHENLRLIATMMVFETGLLARTTSSIRSTADLKGTRMPEGFPAALLFQTMMTGFLVNGGLGWNDVQKVPIADLAKHYEAFKAGRTDVIIATLGSAPVLELNASVDGGVRYIDHLSDTPGARRMREVMPNTYYVPIVPAMGFPGVREPVNIVAFDYVLWAHKGLADDIVRKVTKAMYDGEKELKDTSPLWRSHFSRNMAKDQGLPHHPAAEAFYKEVGIWTR